MFPKMSLKNYLLITYIFIIVVLMSICMLTFHFFVSRNTYENATQHLTQLAEKTISQVDFFIERIDYTSLQIVTSPIIQEIMLENEKENGGQQALKKINNMVVEAATRSNVKQSTSGSRVTIYIKGNGVISAGLPDESSVTERIYQSGVLENYLQIFSSDTHKIILPPHKDYWTSGEQYEMISIIRPIVNFDTYEIQGFVHMQEQSINLYKLLDFNNESMEIKLVDKDGSTIFNTFQEEGVEKEYLKVTAKSKETDWELSIFLKKKDVFYNTLMGGSLMLIFISLVFIVSILVFYYFSKKSIEPLTEMMATVSSIEEENLWEEIPKKQLSKELIQLREAFNSMLKRLRTSVEEVTALKEKEIKAHMRALQAQIDPHFIYNTLAMINAYTRSMESEKIVGITSSLSSMLRYVSDYDQASVEIMEEIDQVEHYLQLMKLRYEERLTYSIIIEDAVYEYTIKIPKLIVQPLVENAFKHGFKNKVSDCKLEIRVGILGEQWFIEVIDNGVGMKKELITEIYNRLEAFVLSPSENIEHLKIDGMGLMNVLVRMKFLYKDHFILQIESGETDFQGCKFTIGGKLT